MITNRVSVHIVNGLEIVDIKSQKSMLLIGMLGQNIGDMIERCGFVEKPGHLVQLSFNQEFYIFINQRFNTLL